MRHKHEGYKCALKITHPFYKTPNCWGSRAIGEPLSHYLKRMIFRRYIPTIRGRIERLFEPL